MTKFYIDGSGKYIGGYDGANPPDGSIEVNNPPEDARMTWDGSKWIIPDDKKDEIIDEKRKLAYDKDGSSIEEMVVALWERVVEGKPEASDSIQVIREKVKQDFPK